MSVAPAPATHIRLDDQGRAWIAGTTYKVLQIVMEHLNYGWSPAEIRRQHYNELSMAQIHAALAYYFDNEAALNAQIEAETAYIESLREAAGPSPMVERLRAAGKLP